MQVKKQQLEPYMEQLTCSKLGKEYDKAVNCYLTSMENTSWETLGWKTHKLEPRLPGDISITSDMQMLPFLLLKENEEELKSLLIKVKEESEKTGLKLNVQKTKIMASGPITSWQIEGEKSGNSDKFYFLGFQNHADNDCSHGIKRLLGRKAMANSVLKAMEKCIEN